jgi:hypothetical protein
VASNRTNSIAIPRLHQVVESRALIAVIADRGFVLPKNRRIEKGASTPADPKTSKAPNPYERNSCYGDYTF